MGKSTEILLTPHIGEFDQEVLVSKSLTYEPGCLSWIEENAHSFDAIVEIGANVGVFTLLFDRACHAPESRTKAVFAFEPSRCAYHRLLQNLALNASTNVLVFPCAVGQASHFTTFYEPEGHLTNGSLLRDFAGIFSKELRENLVLEIDASVLENIFTHFKHILVKIDVEGFEPILMRSLVDLVRRFRPVILIEILERTESALREVLQLIDYEFFLVTNHDLVKYERVFASPEYRDWLLVPNEQALTDTDERPFVYRRKGSMKDF